MHVIKETKKFQQNVNFLKAKKKLKNSKTTDQCDWFL